jgi:alpha-amylase
LLWPSGMRGARPDARIRTPMQWDDSETGGFTSGSSGESLAAGYEALNFCFRHTDSDARSLVRQGLERELAAD